MRMKTSMTNYKMTLRNKNHRGKRGLKIPNQKLIVDTQSEKIYEFFKLNK